MKRRWLSKDRSRRSSMVSNVSARRWSSSSGPVSARRWCRFCSLMRRAASVMEATGRRARPASHQPSRPATTAMITSPIADQRTIWCSAASWTARTVWSSFRKLMVSLSAGGRGSGCVPGSTGCAGALEDSWLGGSSPPYVTSIPCTCCAVPCRARSTTNDSRITPATRNRAEIAAARRARNGRARTNARGFSRTAGTPAPRPW